MPKYGESSNITLLRFNYSVWSILQTGTVTRCGAVVPPTGAFLRSGSALLHFALMGVSPHCTRRGDKKCDY